MSTTAAVDGETPRQASSSSPPMRPSRREATTPSQQGQEPGSATSRTGSPPLSQAWKEYTSWHEKEEDGDSVPAPAERPPHDRDVPGQVADDHAPVVQYVTVVREGDHEYPREGDDVKVDDDEDVEYVEEVVFIEEEEGDGDYVEEEVVVVEVDDDAEVSKQEVPKVAQTGPNKGEPEPELEPEPQAEAEPEVKTRRRRSSSVRRSKTDSEAVLAAAAATAASMSRRQDRQEQSQSQSRSRHRHTHTQDYNHHEKKSRGASSSSRRNRRSLDAKHHHEDDSHHHRLRFLRERERDRLKVGRRHSHAGYADLLSDEDMWIGGSRGGGVQRGKGSDEDLVGMLPEVIEEIEEVEELDDAAPYYYRGDRARARPRAPVLGVRIRQKRSMTMGNTPTSSSSSFDAQQQDADQDADADPRRSGDQVTEDDSGVPGRGRSLRSRLRRLNKIHGTSFLLPSANKATSASVRYHRWFIVSLVLGLVSTTVFAIVSLVLSILFYDEWYIHIVGWGVTIFVFIMSAVSCWYLHSLKKKTDEKLLEVRLLDTDFGGSKKIVRRRKIIGRRKMLSSERQRHEQQQQVHPHSHSYDDPESLSSEEGSSVEDDGYGLREYEYDGDNPSPDALEIDSARKTQSPSPPPSSAAVVPAGVSPGTGLGSGGDSRELRKKQGRFPKRTFSYPPPSAEGEGGTHPWVAGRSDMSDEDNATDQDAYSDFDDDDDESSTGL